MKPGAILKIKRKKMKQEKKESQNRKLILSIPVLP
jgi:hypothetical protein